MPSGTSEPIQIYQLKVTLRGAHKPIWRQFQARSDTTLAKLRRILQAVMGRTDTHLHHLIRGKQYGNLMRAARVRAKPWMNQTQAEGHRA